MENKGFYFGLGMINVVIFNKAIMVRQFIISVISAIMILYLFHKFFEREEDEIFEGRIIEDE